MCERARDDGGASLEPDEVATVVRLQEVLAEEANVAAVARVVRRRPRAPPPLELGLVHEQVDSPRLDVEADAIAVLDERERTADRRLRRDVQDDRAVRGAA